MDASHDDGADGAREAHVDANHDGTGVARRPCQAAAHLDKDLKDLLSEYKVHYDIWAALDAAGFHSLNVLVFAERFGDKSWPFWAIGAFGA